MVAWSEYAVGVVALSGCQMQRVALAPHRLPAAAVVARDRSRTSMPNYAGRLRDDFNASSSATRHDRALRHP